jgi:C_GCAxxG_C_C family probable redox protein
MAEQQGIRSDVIPKIATGFCSGLSRTAGMCGAVSGGVMGIGLALGRSQPGDSVDPTYTTVRAFLQAFREQFELPPQIELTCLQLSGVDLGTPEGQAAFRANNTLLRCQEYAAQAARLATQAIEAFRSS